MDRRAFIAGVAGGLVGDGALTYMRRQQIADLALKHRLRANLRPERVRGRVC